MWLVTIVKENSWALLSRRSFSGRCSGEVAGCYGREEEATRFWPVPSFLPAAFATRATLLVSLAGGGRGGLTDVEAFVCSQRPGRHCLWSMAGNGRGPAEVKVVVCTGGLGRHGLCHWLVVSGTTR